MQRTISSETLPANVVLPQWAELRKRARTLKITTQELALCNTIDDFHELAKKKYRTQLKSAHPDHTASRNRHQAKYGSRLGRVVAAYKWLIAITPEKFAHIAKNRATTPEVELPLDWGVGWAEYDRRYEGYTILPRL